MTRIKLLAPQDRAYMREVFASISGRLWLEILIGMRPPIGGKTTEERSMSASEALGYERAISNMAVLLDEPVTSPELKSVDIRSD